ncbi:MAG: N-acetyltransferase [Planctomycetota bacterium]
MRINLNLVDELDIQPIAGYRFLPWSSNLLSEHAEAKYLSFCNEMDSHVFPCLGNSGGCLKLMNEISCRKGFAPKATWLVVTEQNFENYRPRENCGTVQGIVEKEDVGSIQNLGIVPAHRGKGLGKQILIRSLIGFRSMGLETVTLEVTSKNESALRLYEGIGFSIDEIVYKHADLRY